jgi:hypothetical protein
LDENRSGCYFPFFGGFASFFGFFFIGDLLILSRVADGAERPLPFETHDQQKAVATTAQYKRRRSHLYASYTGGERGCQE